MPDPTPDGWRRVRDAFDAAADRPPADREAALDAACRTPTGQPDPALRAEVEALLAADTHLSFLDVPAAEGAAELVEAAGGDGTGATAEGTRFGAWRVLEEIGRGGMGAVYLVERADGAYAQRAALKRLALAGPAHPPWSGGARLPPQSNYVEPLCSLNGCGAHDRARVLRRV